MVTRRQALRFGLAMAGAGAGLGSIVACGSDSGAKSGGSKKSSGNNTILAGGSDVGIAALMIPALTLAAEENGAKVTFRPSSQSTAQIAMLNGDIDLGFMSFVNLSAAAEQGKDIVGVGPAWASHTSLLVKKDSPYQDAQSLKGKRIGTLKRTVSVYTESYAVIKDLGMDFEKDFELVITDSIGILEGLIKKGEVDAITAYEPNVARMIQAGEVRELFQCAQYWGDKGQAMAPAQNWAARRDWAERFGTERLQKICTRTAEIASTDRKAYTDAAKSLNMPDEKALDALFERFSKLAVSEYTDENLASAQHDLDGAVDSKLIAKKHDVNGLVVRAA